MRISLPFEPPKGTDGWFTGVAIQLQLDNGFSMDAEQIINELEKNFSARRRCGLPTPIDFPFSIIKEWASVSELTASDLLDDLAKCVAIKYYIKEISYESSDWIMNNLFNAVVSSESSTFTELFVEIYNAFDAGEYYRDADRNEQPDEFYTRPAVAAIIQKFTHA